MLKTCANYLSGIPPAYLEGLLYVLIALFTYLQNALGGDEATKYISPAPLFWIKLIIGAFLACWIAIKLFRSTSFADHQAKKNGTSDTQFFPKPPEKPPEAPKP